MGDYQKGQKALISTYKLCPTLFNHHASGETKKDEIVSLSIEGDSLQSDRGGRQSPMLINGIPTVIITVFVRW